MNYCVDCSLKPRMEFTTAVDRYMGDGGCGGNTWDSDMIGEFREFIGVIY